MHFWPSLIDFNARRIYSIKWNLMRTFFAYLRLFYVCSHICDTCVCVCFNETQLQNISFVFKFQSKRKSVQFSNAFVLSGQRYMALYCRIAFEL